MAKQKEEPKRRGRPPKEKTEPKKQETAGKHAGGRPSKYDPKMLLAIEYMARNGLTDAQMSEKLGVSEVTFNAWKKTYPEFLNALKIGKADADDQVEASLFRMATGYEHEVEKPMIVSTGDYVTEVEIVKYTERLAPNPTSMIFWLKNRRPEKWREKQEIEMTGPVEIKHTFDPKGI